MYDELKYRDPKFYVRQMRRDKDPTFDAGIKNVFSPAIKRVLRKMKPLNVRIIFMSFGILDGFRYHPKTIASELKIAPEDVRFVLFTAKRQFVNQCRIQNVDVKKYLNG